MTIEFGKYIREVRKKKGMTSVELAVKSGISQSYLSQMENGKRGIPADQVLLGLSKGLGISYLALLQKAGRNHDTIDIAIKKFLSILLSDHPLSGKIEEDTFEVISRVCSENGVNLDNIDVTPINGEHGSINEKKINNTTKAISNINNVEIKHEILEGLQNVAKRYYLWFSEFDTSAEANISIDLSKLLTNSNVAYKNQPLTDKDKQLLLSYLDALTNN
ncbi:helix-turn-helix transcriptional regulator [Terribacillus goriensis]|uniref:helix-turn-helix domain-containing protein n=1 Tax=Terribacillus saccharophilus TaxID=361277 RepID=UPI003983D47D